MSNREIMQSIANVRNALFHMRVSQEQTHIVSDCVRALDTLLTEFNKQSTSPNMDKQTQAPV